MTRSQDYSVGSYESKKKSNFTHLLPCVIVVIVLAACIATIVTVIYYSDNSPWRESEKADVPACDNGDDKKTGTKDDSGNQPDNTKDGNIIMVKTRLGQIEGILMNTSFGSLVERYLGIPFAEPPVGGNRFRDPKPYTEPYTGGVYKAFEFGNSCIQIPNQGNGTDWTVGTDISEDCLYLNVWVPHPHREKRAVMVWIYGGGFTSGSSSHPLYDGTVLSTYGDVIVVTINYRVSVLGFLPLDIPGQTRGNQGLKDQQMALRWVQENIKQFGGDPKQVTIFGESAGGASVGWHLLTPSSENQFNRAILQPSLVECLKDVPALDLYIAGQAVTSIEFTPWVPVIDEEFIPEAPGDLLESGRINQKDILIGVNKDEGTIFAVLALLDQGKDANITTWLTMANALLGTVQPVQPEEILQAYRPRNESSYEELFVSAAEMLADAAFVCGSNKFSEQFALYGSKVYYYYLTYRSPSNAVPEEWGTIHGADIKWVFGRPFFVPKPALFSTADEMFAKDVMSMWTGFAKYGNPDIQDDFEWKTSSVKIPSYLELKGPNDFMYHQNKTVHQDRCALWF